MHRSLNHRSVKHRSIKHRSIIHYWFMHRSIMHYWFMHRSIMHYWFMHRSIMHYWFMHRSLKSFTFRCHSLLNIAHFNIAHISIAHLSNSLHGFLTISHFRNNRNWTTQIGSLGKSIKCKIHCDASFVKALLLWLKNWKIFCMHKGKQWCIKVGKNPLSGF